MANTVIFSISTPDYVQKGKIALGSLSRNLNTQTDILNFDIDQIKLLKDEKIQYILDRYQDNYDSVRWSLKSAIAIYLLNNFYDKCIYIDNDIYFVNNADFLIADLDGVLLTPHFRPLLPSKQPNIDNQFLALFQDGFFNAGFIAATKNGLPALNWWNNVVSWNCEKNLYQGLYYDQKYLDIMCLEFSDIVHICKHRGCNIAEWNVSTNIINRVNNKWLINEEYEPIFFHFTNYGIKSSWVNNPMIHEYYLQFLKEISIK